MVEMWAKDLVPELSTDLDVACVATTLLRISSGSGKNHTGDESTESQV